MSLLTLFLFLTDPTPALPRVDTVPVSSLDSVMVQGFVQRSLLSSAPAAVSVVSAADWNRFSPASSVAAVNTLPGVRMEERSPGSYRLAIRGSSSRSPFGVRNIRFYYEQFPITDPGGNTYLNLFAPAAFEQLEVLRGPAASVYGAGSGGAVLATGSRPQPGSDTSSIRFRFSLMGGSNGLFQTDAQLLTATAKGFNRVQAHHHQQQGFRDHSAVRRNYLSWQNSSAISGTYTVNTLVLYSNLEYETPGGLTLAQYQTDPKQARPAAGAFPSAQDARAAIYQQSFYGGVHQQWKPVERFQTDILAYGMYNRVTNPAIRNYERRSEPSFGIRAVLGYTIPLSNSTLTLSGGAEWQKGYYQVNVFGNRGGEQDTLQTSDAVTPVNGMVFAQAKWSLPQNWELSGGLSWNNNQISIRRESEVPNYYFSTGHQAEWAPRISIARKFKSLMVYALAARGFSPPTSGEILPSTTVINTELKAEGGWNYELGVRGRVANQRLWIDANIFYFQLKDAIVQRRDASGADYFTNAGSTRQYGLELALRYNPLHAGRAITWQPWANFAYHPFKYRDFIQVEADYSGNYIPGIARNTASLGLDLHWKQYLSLHLTYQYVDPIWLNDANSAKADAFQIAGAQFSGRIVSLNSRKSGSASLRWFAGGDNLFNQQYSLGNDINAVGGRYYNASARRNYFAGIRIQ